MTIEAVGIGVDYGSRVALEAATLSAVPGSIVGLIGPNGSGKSTLLRALCHHTVPDRGTVELDDEPVSGLALRRLARRLAVVAQEPPNDVPYSVASMVLLGRSPHRGSWEGYSRHDHQIVADVLERFGLLDRADDHMADLSGGERQRVLIARAVVQEATHLLLDEPTNHLDVRYQHEILRLVRSLDIVTVIVLHDLNLAARYCDELLVLDRGRVVASGATDDVLVPSVIEEVYGVGVTRVERPGRPVQLIFDPMSS